MRVQPAVHEDRIFLFNPADFLFDGGEKTKAGRCYALLCVMGYTFKIHDDLLSGEILYEFDPLTFVDFHRRWTWLKENQRFGFKSSQDAWDAIREEASERIETDDVDPEEI